MPRTGLYLFSAACGLFASGYGALGLALVGPVGFIRGATLRLFIVS